MESRKELVKQELESLAKKGRGLLRPEAVVDFAKDTQTALHDEFEWDDSVAGHAHRLWQARQLIAVIVRHEPRIEQEVQVYVSLPSDRTKEGGGYRRMVDVLSDAERRQQLLDAALAELAVFERKYGVIKELASVFSEVRKVRAQKHQKVRRRAFVMAK